MPDHVVDEYRRMTSTGFEYAEPTQAQDFVTSAAGNLPFYPPDLWLRGPSTISEGHLERTHQPWALCDPHTHQPWALCDHCVWQALLRVPQRC